MYEQIDEKARKLLKKVCWWKREDIFTEEEIQYGIEKGVFFQPITLHHDDVIAEIQTRANEIELKEAVNAFLYSRLRENFGIALFYPVYFGDEK